MYSKAIRGKSTAVEMVDTEQDINIDDMNDSGNMEVCLVCLFVCLFFHMGVFESIQKLCLLVNYVI